jgi:hypothetical protein
MEEQVCTYPLCPDHHPDENEIAYHESGAMYDSTLEDYQESHRTRCTAPETVTH